MAKGALTTATARRTAAETRLKLLKEIERELTAPGALERLCAVLDGPECSASEDPRPSTVAPMRRRLPLWNRRLPAVRSASALRQ
jgi:hypothetical protein